MWWKLSDQHNWMQIWALWLMIDNPRNSNLVGKGKNMKDIWYWLCWNSKRSKLAVDFLFSQTILAKWKLSGNCESNVSLLLKIPLCNWMRKTSQVHCSSCFFPPRVILWKENFPSKRSHLTFFSADLPVDNIRLDASVRDDLKNFSSPNYSKFAVHRDWHNEVFQNVQNVVFFRKKMGPLEKKEFFKITKGGTFAVCLSNEFFSYSSKRPFYFKYCAFFSSELSENFQIKKNYKIWWRERERERERESILKKKRFDLFEKHLQQNGKRENMPVVAGRLISNFD